MTTQPTKSTVLVADADMVDALTARLPRRFGPVTLYRNLEQLLAEQPLSGVSVLVLRLPGMPLGILLPTLARMHHEYPDVQKVAVVPAPPPLPIAEYLTACQVDLLGEDADRLADIVQRLHERARWIAA